MSLREPFKSGPYRVEITRPCFVQGMHCEPGETISLAEEDALCLESSTRGRIVGRPPEEDDIVKMVFRLIEQRFRDVPRI